MQKIVNSPKIVGFILVVLFITPILAASYYFLQRQQIKLNFKVNGNLVKPYKLEFLPKTKWHLVLKQPKSCNASCKDKIKMLQNVIKALGKLQHKASFITIETELLDNNQLAICDKNANVILQYDKIEPRLVLADLKRLVKY